MIAMHESEVLTKAKNAREAARRLACVDTRARNEALLAMADALVTHETCVLDANALDIAAAREEKTAEPLIDRLALDHARLSDIADALRSLAAQNDPLGTVVEGRTLYNGIRLRRVRVPLGVVAMIYEARPNVTADAAGLCLKTANACLLRGGSLANRSNIAMTRVLYEAGCACGMPQNWLQSIETTDRGATSELMQLTGLVDVLIPRGSASLIRTTVENARVPVIETGEGNCHLYIHTDADPAVIAPIVVNAKTQRPGVCNAVESILIDNAVLDRFAPVVIEALAPYSVKMHADAAVCALAEGMSQGSAALVVTATEEDWGREYLGLEVSIKSVSGIDEAIEHINAYSTHHSESILSQDYEAVGRFLREIDSAAVYANASTRFTDGGEFGLGAEIGISTQKLHARGPMGLEALTSTKFVLEGNGQVR
jgi:glutamate-5-semialdehyde dehydrogenase